MVAAVAFIRAVVTGLLAVSITITNALTLSAISSSSPIAGDAPLHRHSTLTCIGIPAPLACDRRSALSCLLFLVGGTASLPAAASLANPDARAVTTVVLDSPSVRAGVELFDVTIGTPPKSYPAVKSLSLNGAAFASGVQPGMILLGQYPDGSRSIVQRIRNGPYPIVLQFYNLAAGGDAYGDLGRPIVSADDALTMARQASKEASEASVKAQSARPAPGAGLVTRTVRAPRGGCGIKSRRGDIMEIRYEARIDAADGPIYDSSDQRGTGQPYQYVLGNGDVIKGVDLGTYDMCPGEVRELNIPAVLGYGSRGSRLFGIPGDARLWWRVELVALNFVKEGQNDRGRDELYDGGSGMLPVYQ